MQVVWCGMVTLLLGSMLQAAESSEPEDYRYEMQVLGRGMSQPMELEIAPDGRIFFNELNGRLRFLRPGTNAIVDAGKLLVFEEQENGFLGFALDPGFTRNGWIYLFYSPRDLVGQRLSRFQINGDTLDLNSERTLLEFPEQRRECCHHAGSVEFGPHGLLFISTGDNTHPGGDSAGYGPLDERVGREAYDAQKSAGNTHDLRGKILRIHPEPDGTYSVPEGNLFPRDGSKGRPEIYAMGCRNPWRMSVDAQSGFVYWGEVGPDAGGDSPRGPRGYDEINQARAPGNFGWPYFVGSNFAYARYDFATQKIGPRYDWRRPLNESPNNTGARVLPPAVPALIYWPYGTSAEFPELGGGGRTACAGPVFHFRSEFRATSGFPEQFDGCLLFWDWQRPFIKWARLDRESKLQGLEPFVSTIKVANEKIAVNQAEAQGQFVIKRPVDMQFGNDGCLYLLDYGESWGPNPDCKLVRISYRRGNLSPVAAARSTVAHGREPLLVELSSEGSHDPEGGPLTFEWRRHPGNQFVSSNATVVLTLEQPGNYVLELRVNDEHGASGTAQLPIMVGNSAPAVRFLEPSSNDFFTPGETVAFRLDVKDAEDGNSADYEELFEGRSFVQGRWTRNPDGAAETDPVMQAMQRSDCFNCHALSQKVVGPALVDIAAKYRGQSDAVAAVATRVLNGSSGVWGEIPMLPHPQLTRDQVEMMVRWIQDLKPSETNAFLVRGLTGKLTPPVDAKLKFGQLEASVTDAGRAGAGVLTGKATVTLRRRRLEAEASPVIHGARVLGQFVGAIDHGHYVGLGPLNLTTSASVTCRVASDGAGGILEVRLRSPSGETVGKVSVPPTGGWDKWIELTTPIKAAGRADVFLVFSNPGKGALMNLDWVEFNPSPSR